MAHKPGKEQLLEKLAVPLHPRCIPVPDYIDTFGRREVEELSVEEWRSYSKAKYEALKKRFLNGSLRSRKRPSFCGILVIKAAHLFQKNMVQVLRGVHSIVCSFVVSAFRNLIINLSIRQINSM